MYFLYIYPNWMKQNQIVYCLILNKTNITGNQKKKNGMESGIEKERWEGKTPLIVLNVHKTATAYIHTAKC